MKYSCVSFRWNVSALVRSGCCNKNTTDWVAYTTSIIFPGSGGFAGERRRCVLPAQTSGSSFDPDATLWKEVNLSLSNEREEPGAFTLEKTPCYDDVGGLAPAEACSRLMAGNRTRVRVWLGLWHRLQWVLQTDSA